MNTAPAHSEIEVSLFGPGYGESIVLHLGEDSWFIVDSCIDPATGEPAPLTYLHRVQIDPAVSVQQVIATHWHDDHIRGLGRIVQECASASFVCSAALREQEFLTLVTAYGQRSMMASPGVQEFYEVIRALEARSQRQSIHVPIFATAGRCLWQHDVNVAGVRYACTIHALSPSDVSILLAHQHIASLLPQEKVTKIRVPALTPNHAAVVLWVDIGGVFILLGSDLEETGHQGTGWSVILGSSTYPQGKASVFKVPHHGSQTAHHAQVWQGMLNAEPYAVLTPFALGSVSLPTRQDVDRICTRTAQAYTTAIPRQRRRRGRPNAVEKTIRETVRFIREVIPATGHVRLRADLTTRPLLWQVELFGDARPLNQVYVV